MKISIITAVRNREATIAQAIESVAAQNWRNVEHLVIDGASSDGTLAAIQAAAHPRMHLLSEPDQGIYDALNKGARLSTGEVIGLVHSDDFLAHPRVLDLVAAAFETPGVLAAYGDLDYVSAADVNRIVRRWRSGPFEPHRLRRGWMPPHPALFIRREVLERHGAYDTSYGIAADYEAILRWFGEGDLKAVHIPEVLVKMRLGGASNRSLGRIIRKSREDYRALKANGIGGLGTLAGKNFGKLGQFVPSGGPA